MKPDVTWKSADPSNHSRGRGGAAIDLIVIHTEQGTETGTAEWFANPEAHVSAHYGVGLDGSVEQFVSDEDEAWHCGNAAYNRRSIGIELEGFAEQSDFPTCQLDGLAQLCAWLCSTYQIPTDRQHLIGHCEVPDPGDPTQTGGAGHHTDPGVTFPWNDLMQRLIAPSPALV